MRGTARYVSLNTHLGIEQSRRDDLEALGYVLTYFLRGSLPWQGLQAGNRKQKYEKISEKKVSTSFEALCQGYPTEFISYFKYCRSLRFDDKPSYAHLKEIFRDLFIREGFQFDNVFDWTILKYQQSQLSNPPSRALATAGTSSGAPPFLANVNRQSGGDEGKAARWLATNSSCSRNAGNSKRSKPVASDSVLYSGISRQPAVSSCHEPAIAAADSPYTRGHTIGPTPIGFQNVSSTAQRSSLVSSDQKRNSSSIHGSDMLHLDTALKGIKGLHLNQE